MIHVRRFCIGYAMASCLAIGCGSAEAPDPPDLRGQWVFDAERAEQLYVVSSMPEGPERDRALQRAKRDMKDLEVDFDEQTATLHTPWSERTVHYEVVRWYGPLVDIVGRRDPYAPPVSSSLELEGEHLTWFDADGEVEFVLRRN